MKQVRSINEGIKKVIQEDIRFILDDFIVMHPNVTFDVMAVEINLEQGTIQLSFNTLFDFYRTLIQKKEDTCLELQAKLDVTKWHYQNIANIQIIDPIYIEMHYKKRKETYIRYVIKYMDLLLNEYVANNLPVEKDFFIYYYSDQDTMKEALQRLRTIKKY